MCQCAGEVWKRYVLEKNVHLSYYLDSGRESGIMHLSGDERFHRHALNDRQHNRYGRRIVIRLLKIGHLVSIPVRICCCSQCRFHVTCSRPSVFGAAQYAVVGHQTLGCTRVRFCIIVRLGFRHSFVYLAQHGRSAVPPSHYLLL
jgi:hypothetical protein